MNASFKGGVEPPVVEIVAIIDTFIVGMEPVEDRGDFVRLTFWSDHQDVSDHTIERVIVARLVATKATYCRMIRQMGGEAPIIAVN